MTNDFIYGYSHKNDGSPSAYSSEQKAIDNALVAFSEAGGTDWRALTIEPLPCDARDLHYPDACWHYKVTITPGEVELGAWAAAVKHEQDRDTSLRPRPGETAEDTVNRVVAAVRRDEVGEFLADYPHGTVPHPEGS